MSAMSVTNRCPSFQGSVSAAVAKKQPQKKGTPLAKEPNKNSVFPHPEPEIASFLGSNQGCPCSILGNVVKCSPGTQMTLVLIGQGLVLWG